MKTRQLYYMDCHLAGRKYHDVDEVWDELHVGTQLLLVRDLDNRFDANAVAVVYRKTFGDDESEDFMLGYISQDENERIAGFLEMGWSDIFECRISKLDPEAHPEHQVMLTIKIVRNK